MDRTIETVKKLELEILKYISEICEKNDIKYYLLGGTLLGAIRHQGFIPWDDDIDIGIIREDYNKLITILSEDTNDLFFVQNYETDTNYPRYITKIRLNGTKFLEYNVKDFDMHHGIFVDIFPLDKTRKKSSRILDFRVFLAKKILIVRLIKNGTFKHKNNVTSIIAQSIHFPLKLIPIRFFNKTIDYIYGYENSKYCDYIINFSSQYGWRKQTFPIDVYGEGTHVEFEGHKFMAPTKWEVILKSLYGDYMKLPPEEKRNSGHDLVLIDLGKYAEN